MNLLKKEGFLFLDHKDCAFMIKGQRKGLGFQF